MGGPQENTPRLLCPQSSDGSMTTPFQDRPGNHAASSSQHHASSSHEGCQVAANAQDGTVLSRRFIRQQLTWSVIQPKDNYPADGRRDTIQSPNYCIPATKNHTGSLVGNELYIFGGYDGHKNHNMLFVYDVNTYEWRQPHVEGSRPSGRNGHSATLIERNGSEQLLILGGWLGNGPLAAGDLHILHLHPVLRWVQPSFKGEPPGPCNMHTADCVNGTVLVFRGGDGRAYLNDLHALDVARGCWAPYKTTGEVPLPRANHASAVDKMKLYIFGGWDGTKRLNDLYILDTSTRVWTAVRTLGQPPQARAGMSLSYVNGLLYLFGGSGHTTRCFNDVHVFDPEETTWYEGNPLETYESNESSNTNTGTIKDGNAVGGGGSSSSNHHALTDGYRDSSVLSGSQLGQRNNCGGGGGGGLRERAERAERAERGLVGSDNMNIGDYGPPRPSTPSNAPWSSSSSGPRTMPERRAGHAAVTVGSRIFVFGGACGTQYYGKGKCFILSTDAPPSMSFDSAEHMPRTVRHVLAEYFDNQQFSDVTFAFKNDSRKLYAHRVLLTLFSDHFRRLFTSGMRECHEECVMLPEDVSYDVFRSLLEFMYAGQLKVGQECDIVWLMDLLRAADQFCVDPVTRLCEERVSRLVDQSNVVEICSEASRLQATSLVKYCQWLMRQEGREDDEGKLIEERNSD